MSFNSKEKIISGCEAEVEVKMSQDDFKEYWDNLMKEEMSKVQIKGFRKGQGPEDVLKKIVDQEKVFELATEKAIKASLKKITEEKEWVLIDSPRIEFEEVKEGISFKAHLTFLPKVDLKDYKDLIKEINKKSKEERENIDVKDEEVEKAVEWLLKSREESKEEKDLKLTDELAQKIGSFKNAEELKNSIREGIKAEKTIREADKARAKMVDELLKKLEVDVPKVMKERMAEGMREDLKHSLEETKSSSYDEYVKKHFENEEKLMDNFRKQAEKEIRAHIILDEIMKKEGIEVKNEEVEEEMNKILKQVPKEEKDKTDLERIYNYSYGKVKNEKVFRFLEKI